MTLLTKTPSSWPYNYHAHTRYGDGHCNSADYAVEAIRRGMRVIGISEHTPLGAGISWTMDQDMVQEYRQDLLELRDRHAGELEVLHGLEADWWPERSEWWRRIRKEDWDYLIGSVHHVARGDGFWVVDSSPPRFEKGLRELFSGDVRAACEAFFACECAAARSGRFDILGHFDLVKKFNKNGHYFDSSAAWYRETAATVVDAAAASGIIVEVNTAGWDKPVEECYPAPWLIERCVQKGVRLTLNADAHAAAEIQRHFDRALIVLAGLGVKELWRLADGAWKPEPITPFLAGDSPAGA